MLLETYTLDYCQTSSAYSRNWARRQHYNSRVERVMHLLTYAASHTASHERSAEEDLLQSMNYDANDDNPENSQQRFKWVVWSEE